MFKLTKLVLTIEQVVGLVQMGITTVKTIAQLVEERSVSVTRSGEELLTAEAVHNAAVELLAAAAQESIDAATRIENRHAGDQ